MGPVTGLVGSSPTPSARNRRPPKGPGSRGESGHCTVRRPARPDQDGLPQGPSLLYSNNVIVEECLLLRWIRRWPSRRMGAVMRC